MYSHLQYQLHHHHVELDAMYMIYVDNNLMQLNKVILNIQLTVMFLIVKFNRLPQLRFIFS